MSGESHHVGIGRAIGGSPFVNGPQPGGFGIKMYYNEESRRTRGVIVFDATKMGPPGCAHGGAIATVLDEAMGAAAWFNGHPVLAVNLNVDLKHSVPLDTEIEVTGWIERIEGRKRIWPPRCSCRMGGWQRAAPACSSKPAPSTA